MSSVNKVVDTNNQQFNNYDTQKIFVWEPRTEVAEYTNDTYDEVELPAGTVMGRVAADDSVVPLTSAATDGSQFPVGILFAPLTVAAGATVNATICVSGDVVESKIVLQGADTLQTVVSNRTIKDRIGADTVGIKLVGGEDLSAFDNS